MTVQPLRDCSVKILSFEILSVLNGLSLKIKLLTVFIDVSNTIKGAKSYEILQRT